MSPDKPDYATLSSALKQNVVRVLPDAFDDIAGLAQIFAAGARIVWSLGVEQQACAHLPLP